MTRLAVPDVTGMDVINAALAYAEAGWYVGPIDMKTKHAGSVLGKGWPAKTSRDPKMIISWLALAGHGIFLHAGRSGAVVFDVDHPGGLPAALAEALTTVPGPFQSTRTTEPRRGHYPYLVPAGRMLGNSAGELGRGWGEVRGRNGIIVVEPTIHEKAADGGRYHWAVTGRVPLLPDTLVVLLPDTLSAEDAATDAEVAAFLAEHTSGSRPRLLLGPSAGSRPRSPPANPGTSPRSAPRSGRPGKHAPGITRRRSPSTRSAARSRPR